MKFKATAMILQQYYINLNYTKHISIVARSVHKMLYDSFATHNNDYKCAYVMVCLPELRPATEVHLWKKEYWPRHVYRPKSVCSMISVNASVGKCVFARSAAPCCMF